MKVNMVKMGMVAALVVGACSSAYAGNDVQLKVLGSIAATTCDLAIGGGAPSVLDIGSFPASVIGANIGDVTAAKSMTLNVSNCTGADLPTSGQMQVNVTGDGFKDTGWGDKENMGFVIQMKADGTEITPNATGPAAQSSFPVGTVASADTPAASLTMDPVALSFALKSTALEAGILSGTETTNLLLTTSPSGVSTGA